MWKLLSIISYSSLILPNFIFKLIWRLLDIFDGKFGAILRYILISKKLKKCGSNVYFGPFVFIESIENLSLGSNISIHHQCTLICSGEVEIGDNVSVAHASSIVSTNHTWSDIDIAIKYNPVIKEKVILCDDIWIGCGVRILAGAKINRRCIVAAGAVVNKELDSRCIYGGIPARFLKSIYD